VRRTIDPHRAALRILISAFAGAVAAAVSWTHVPPLAVLIGWNTTGIVLLGLTWFAIITADTHETRSRAAADDPGRTLVYVIVLIASAASLFAAFVLLRQANTIARGEGRALVVLCLSTVALAWALTNTAFTMRYARLYYREDSEGVGGVEFPGKQLPSYFDFAYFAFTIGMTFQVSDTCVTSPQIRRAVLMHGVISFVYNTAILAFVLNLVFGRAT
jgi:uncharacterized membrane protein